MLLAQLEAAKWILNELRNLLAESLNVEKDKALSIVIGPRVDEDNAQPVKDILGQSDENWQSLSQSNPRERSGAPSGDDEDNAASEDF